MTPVFSWLANSAGYFVKPWVIAVVIAAVAVIIAEKVQKIRHTRATRIVVRAIGLLFLTWGLVLIFVNFREPKVKVPPTVWVWMPTAGLALIVMAWYLRKRAERAARERVGDISNAAAKHIEGLRKKRDATDFVEQLTTEGEPVAERLITLVRRRRKGRHIVLAGPPGSGKTATLLKLAAELQSSRGRPVIAIYVDLADYAAQSMAAQAVDDLSLSNYILGKFHQQIQADVKKAWNESDLDVGWVFLFDNADESSLQWDPGERSWQREVTSFVYRDSWLAPFHAVVAASAIPKKPPAYHVVWLGRLSPDGRDKFLAHAGVAPTVAEALARDKSLDWYLTNPAALRLLAPALARPTWTSGNNVYEAMGQAIDLVLRKQSDQETEQNLLRVTAIAAIEFLRMRENIDRGSPVEESKVVEHIKSATGASEQEIGRALTALANGGIIKRPNGRGGIRYLESYPAVEGYFYAHALAKSSDQIPVSDMLFDPRYRLTAVSLLKIAKPERLARFTQEAGSMLERAIAGLSGKSEPSQEAIDQSVSAYRGLSVLIEGMQDRLELLNELRSKAIDFTTRAMRIPQPDLQAGLLEVSYVLGTPEQAMAAMAGGLDPGDGAIVLDTASRIVTVMSDVTELNDARRRRLVVATILAGLRSLTASRARSDVPHALRLADGVGAATIILYGVLFGLGGLLQLSKFWQHPLPQAVEICTALLVAGPMVAARYNRRWCTFLLGKDIQSGLEVVSGLLAVSGTVIAIYVIFHGLMTFAMPLMPLLVSYSLIWPACALFYLMADQRPTIANVAFPVPRSVHALWHAYRERPRADHSAPQS